jgi:hypothetical protein
LTRPPVAEPWPLHVGQRRMAEAEAIFLQFQDQLRSLLNEANPGTIRAKDRFRYLPGAGYLPLDTGEFVADTFFDDVQTAPAEIDGAFLRWYIEDGMLLDPIDLADPPSLLLFTTGSNVSPAYLVFQRRHREQITVVDESPGTPTDTTGQKPGGINVDVGVKKSGGPPGSIRPDVVIEQKLITATTAGGASTGGASTGGTNFMATTVLAAPTSKGIIGPAESIVSARYLDLIDKVNLDVIDVEIDERHIKVTATDDLGREYPGVFVEPRRITGLLVAAGVTLRRGRARFAIKNLPPGNYTVTARLFGFKSASQRRAVLAGQTPLVTLDLVRTTKGLPEIPEKPKALGPGKWIGPGWYDKVGLLPEYVRWPWPEPELIPNFDPVVDPPPPEVAEWLQDWVGWLQTEYPEAPIDPGGIRIFVNRDHTPDTVPQDAYAYAVFGDGGAFMPITLTPTDRSFAIDVPVAKGELAGIDRDLAGALANAGLGNLDLLAASWSGLVADTLGIGTSAAIDVIGESRTKVDSLQGTLGMLTGVDEGLITALAESDLNITSLAMLANADRQELASQLAGAGVTQAFAARLIDEARRTVSAGDWSLGPGALGLAPSEVSGLEAIGITSQGSFKAAAAKSELKAEIAETLGVSEAAIDALADTITIKDSKAIVTEIQEAAPVSSATGVTGATAIKLANLNIKTLGDLRKADPNLVAGVFGGNIGMAETAIGSARFKIGGN